jgi:hypothetical protein
MLKYFVIHSIGSDPQNPDIANIVKQIIMPRFFLEMIIQMLIRRNWEKSFGRDFRKGRYVNEFYGVMSLSSAEPYEFLVKLRNITWETNYVIVSQNALGMMGRRKLRKAYILSTIGLTPRRAPLNVLYYPYIIPTNPI